MKFYKYSATGNDFVILDNRKGELEPQNIALWQKVCRRRAGVGADGVIFVENSREYDFKMTYLNADGAEVSMCGNGSRAASHFCHRVLGMSDQLEFETKNGVYRSRVVDDYASVQMSELYDQEKIDLSDFGYQKFSYLNTGVPHAVFEIEDLDKIDINNLALPVRHDKRFLEGVNVNFFEKVGAGKMKLRTFERGVEGETLSCGTGATAAAIFFNKLYGGPSTVEITTPGGTLFVALEEEQKEIWLKGEVSLVYLAESDLNFLK